MSSETPTKDKASSNQTKTIVITVVAVIVFAAAAGNYLKNKKSTVETDSDRDGIVDSQDKCPDENGPVEFMGCPENSYAAQERPPLSIQLRINNSKIKPLAQRNPQVFQIQLNHLVKHRYQNKK